MELKLRNYQTEEDYWRIRAFLRETFLLNERHAWNWQAARLDYWRWHVVQNGKVLPTIEDAIFIWETKEGAIGAVINPEGPPGETFLQVHPAARSADLEEEMIHVAEEELAETTKEGRERLTIWAHAHDTLRQQLLQRLGYRKGEWPEYQRRRFLDGPIPQPELLPGYSVRPLSGEEELPARSWVTWRAFHPDEPDDKYGGWEWYHNIQSMPMYRQGLDIVAVAPDGEVAAFCTVWFDDVTRTGYFEPVGTAPEHQRRGLGKAVLFEGLRRLKERGAVLATVAGYSMAANALYASVMGEEYKLLERWHKEW